MPKVENNNTDKAWIIRPLSNIGIEVEAVTRLVLDAFTEFIAADYTPEGRQEIEEYLNPKEFSTRIRSGKFFILVAASRDKNELIGMIEVESLQHITLLFVDKRHHGQGIARALLEAAVNRCRSGSPSDAMPKITVHASRFGVPAYKRLGFIPQGPEKQQDGRVFLPMVLSPNP
ncbi:MAG: GNAT family N-acetyltransferase [Lentisphaeria bacterium]